MKIFFGSIFIEKQKLIDAKIKYPIKIEYYKLLNEDQIINNKKPKYGIKVIKTEYKENNIKVEEEKIQYLSNDERKIDEVLMMLKRNEVTPVAVQDVISDYSKQIITV